MRILILVELGLWIFISACSSFISVVWLRKSLSQADSHDTVKHRATITVAIITALFCVFNIAFLCVHHEKVVLTPADAPAEEYHYYFKVSLITIPLNSMLNPVVYVVRKRQLREYVRAGLVSINRVSLNLLQSAMACCTSRFKM